MHPFSICLEREKPTKITKHETKENHDLRNRRNKAEKQKYSRTHKTKFYRTQAKNETNERVNEQTNTDRPASLNLHTKKLHQNESNQHLFGIDTTVGK